MSYFKLITVGEIIRKSDLLEIIQNRELVARLETEKAKTNQAVRTADYFQQVSKATNLGETIIIGARFFGTTNWRYRADRLTWIRDAQITSRFKLSSIMLLSLYVLILL